MLKRYELTDQEWEQIAPLLPSNKGKRGRPQKDNRQMLNAMVWLARSGAPWKDLPERYGSWKSVYSRFRKWIDDGILDNMLMYGKEASNRKQEIDRQHHTIPNQRPKDKHYGIFHNSCSKKQ